MSKKFTSLLVIMVLTLFCVISLNAQDTTYVDKTKARQQIEVLKNENATLESENNKLSTDNENLQKQIDEWTSTIKGQIEPMEKKVTQKATDIRALLTTIVDENMRKQASDALNDALALQRKLGLKKQQLENSIYDANNKKTANTVTINRNIQKIELNTANIADLEAAIKETEKQDNILQDYLNSVNSFESDSESLLADVEEPAEGATDTTSGE